MALAFKATTPAPSYTFIKEPVTVILPSGNIIHFSLFFNSLISCFSAKGFVGSIGYSFTTGLNILIYHFLEIVVLIANINFSGINEATSNPSNKDVWFAIIRTLFPAFS